MSDQPEDESKGVTSNEGERANDTVVVEPPQSIEQPPESVEPVEVVPSGGDDDANATVEPVETVPDPVETEPVEFLPDMVEPAPEPVEIAPEPVEVAPDLVEIAPEPVEPAPEPQEPEPEPPNVEDEIVTEPPAQEGPIDNVEPAEEEVAKAEEPGDVESPPADEGQPVEASGDALRASSQEQATPEDSGAETKAEHETEGNDAVQAEEIRPSESKPGDIDKNEGSGEANTPSKPGSRRPTTDSELQKLTTTDIIERLKKSYDQASRTLAVIANIQRKESVLKLEDHKLELIKKFKTFEGHLEQLGLVTERSTQTLKVPCDCKSVPIEDSPMPQDILPQVIVCGREEQVPSIIVCDSYKKSNQKNPAQLEREKLLKAQKELVNKCEFLHEKLMFKETIIANLHKQICLLQNENSLLRKDLASRPTNPETSQDVCLAHCPLHCKPLGTSSPEPSENESILVHKDSASQDSTEQRNICSPKCPNYEEIFPIADGHRSSKQDSKTSGTVAENLPEGSGQHVCPPRCPYYKANANCRKSSKEDSKSDGLEEHVCPSICSGLKENGNCRRSSKQDSKTSSITLESQADSAAKHVCPSISSGLEANVVSRRSSKQDSKTSSITLESQADGAAKHVCPSISLGLEANVDCQRSLKQDSKTSSIIPKNQADGAAKHICPPRCPYFKVNLPVVKEEQPTPCCLCNKTKMHTMEEHVCSMSCPYFKDYMPEKEEETRNMQHSNICKGSQPDDTLQCGCPSKFQSARPNQIVENIDIEIQDENIGCHCQTGIVPNDERMEGEEANAQIVMRLCSGKTAQPEELNFCELKKEYTCLKKDFNNRMVELEALRKDIDKHKEIAEQACVAQQRAEIQAKNIADVLKTMEDKNLMMMVPKERMMEMEQQIVVAKERFLESQDELEELRELTRRQVVQLEDYKHKYLASHELVEEQKGQIDTLEMENGRISENVALEIQHVKNQFEVRLQALAPLPDVLKSTQEKLQELQQQQEVNERKLVDMEKELEIAQDKVREYAKQLDDSITSSNMEIEGQGSTKKKFAKLQSKYHTLQEENTALLKTIVDMEEVASSNQIRLTEKLHEVAQLGATLEMLRVESARQVSRAKERLDSVRDALQTQIMELEKQVAESRAIARTARKDKESIRQSMQCQINSLHESFEHAQATILALQEQIGFFNDAK